MGFRIHVFCLLILFPFNLFGGEWIVVGPRALGMGGAGVAATTGPLAAYWNPANLAFSGNILGIALPASAGYATPGRVIKQVDAIYDKVKDIDFDQLEEDIFNSGQTFTQTHLDDLRNLLYVVTEKVPKLSGKGKGVVASLNTELGFQLKNFAFSARGLGWGGARAVADLSASGLAFGASMQNLVGNGQDRSGELSASGQALADQIAAAFPGVTQNQAEELVYQAEQAGVNTADPTVQEILTTIADATSSGGATIDNFISRNKSGIKTRGLAVGEIGLSYAHPVSLLGFKLAAGATVKAMYGVTHTKDFTLSNLESGGDVFSDLTDRKNRKESWNVGVDLGATIQPLDLLAIGVVARNLNQPKFSAVGKDYELDPQVRAGAALFPTDWITVAADIDLTKNRSEALPGYSSQMVGCGAEISLLSFLFLRGGVSKNILKDEGVNLHAGFGIHAGPVHIEAAGAVTTKMTKIESGDNAVRIPDRGNLSLMIEVAIDL